jgi:hypothetical protein
MKSLATSSRFVLTGIILSVVLSSMIAPTMILAQGIQGQNAVYNSTPSCCAGSSAFIDASMFLSGDICSTIYGILSPPRYSTAVIDARGIASGLTCAAGTSPWYNGTTYLNKTSTILLPAGTVVISMPWILPNGTRLIGVGASDPALDASGSQTMIQAAASFSPTGAMIQFGDSNCPANVCTGIAVEHLTLDGNNLQLTGIQNQWSQNLSYVDHVTLYRVLGTGLSIGTAGSGSALNSGPYSNIVFNTGTSSSGSAVCAQIKGLKRTLGIHGLTCTVTSATNAILLDASNNTLEDIQFTGFNTGIVVGSQTAAASNVLKNVSGNMVSPAPGPAVLISSANPVTDLAIMGASNTGNQTEEIIVDQVTSTTLVTNSTQNSVAMYVLGQPANGGYSRYMTSPPLSPPTVGAATWGFGGNYPQGNCPSGSLYSCIGTSTTCTTGTVTATLWGCSNGSWKGIK